ncbi:MAG: 2,3-bisphosphoglycerate-independent phosphoglycerate mutase [Flavobacteriaceae bacterium]|nr:2,3-bisphosphoglycerate-independent phosphoglycerate mutase [Flavobacteriaceae bacterium]
MSQKVILMILDGWGIAPDQKVSAIDLAKTPFIDSLYKKYNHTTLRTDGLHVGLPKGQMGNSEVGHMNIGAGRIVYQDLAKISMAINNNQLVENLVLIQAIEYAKKKQKPIHLMGLLSDGGVHSHIDHLEGLMDTIKSIGHQNVKLHAFTDGRDVDPKSGKGFVSRIEKFMDQSVGELCSVIGRYYAMDRDNRWERIKKAYDLLVKGQGMTTTDFSDAIEQQYNHGITDEFLPPIVKIDSNHQPISKIKSGDVVLFFNFRTDRGRELTSVLSQRSMDAFDLNPLDLYVVTMTNYDDSFRGIKVLFDRQDIKDTLGEILSKESKTQLRIAETEKYPHVTYFFNGGQETPFENEYRIICPSPKVATYDLQPQMSTYQVRDQLIEYIHDQHPDFICVNFANPDMVGHTGVLSAAIKACETVDACVASVIKTATKEDYISIIMADHGNCETMKTPNGTPHTSHTTNPVPLILVDSKKRKVKSGILGDIAPTVLDLMGIQKPDLMDGQSLINNQ